MNMHTTTEANGSNDLAGKAAVCDLLAKMIYKVSVT
jgi:hypothetical protein